MPCGPYAIVFVTPFDLDTKAVDLATGRHGYGHVALWAGHMTKDDEPIVLDSAIGLGVSFRTLSQMSRGVPCRKKMLSESLGQWVFNRAVQCVGCEYDYGGLMRRRVSEDSYTCSGLICCSLPEHIQRAARPAGRPIAPNDLARHFGVPRWVS